MPIVFAGFSGSSPLTRGKPLSAFLTFFALGSSPLTRGKPCLRDPIPGPRRLIPAHAGKTRRQRSLRTRRPAHPRSRGENLAPGWHPRRSAGSSPLTRGKRRVPRRRILREGLIPAHAGKTMSCHWSATDSPAHPRSRGENACAPTSPARQSGSSPLTRGKLWLLLVQARGAGLIPAHAGKT